MGFLSRFRKQPDNSKAAPPKGSSAARAPRSSRGKKSAPPPDLPKGLTLDQKLDIAGILLVLSGLLIILAFIGAAWLAIWVTKNADTLASWGSDGSGSYTFQWNFSSGGSGLLLRQLAAIPHYIVLAFIGIAAFFIWFVVQWIILFVARYPAGLYEVTEGYMRWTTRVSAYALGLIDRYPPFTLSPSLLAKAPPAAPWPAAPAADSWPSAPPSSAATGAPPPPPPVSPQAAPIEPAESLTPPPPQAPRTPEQPQEPAAPEAPKQP